MNLVDLRSPAKAFLAEEKDTIIMFVKAADRLLALDEEVRQLAAMQVNHIIAPFGMRRHGHRVRRQPAGPSPKPATSTS